MTNINKKINLILLIILTVIMTSCDQNIGERKVTKTEFINNK